MEKFDQDLEKFDQELENFKSVRKFWNKNFQDMDTKIFFPEFGFSKTFFSKTWFPPFALTYQIKSNQILRLLFDWPNRNK